MATNGLTVHETMEIAMDKRVSTLDAAARDEGHSPERWEYGTDDSDLTARTTCETCGADLAVRVGPDREWWAGKMRLRPCPYPKEVVS